MLQDEMNRLRAENRRQEEEYQVVVHCVADLEHLLHQANKKIQQLEAKNTQNLEVSQP